jgi:hypothetical protein
MLDMVGKQDLTTTIIVLQLYVHDSTKTKMFDLLQAAERVPYQKKYGLRPKYSFSSFT